MKRLAIILAGGAATRMGGGDKTALTVGDQTLLEHVLAATAGWSTVVVGPRPAVSVPEGVRWTREVPPGGGPVAGLRAGMALAAVDERLVAVLSADLPFLDTSALETLVSALRSGTSDAAAFVSDGRRQYLCAVWRSDALKARLTSAHDSMRSVYDGATVTELNDLRGASADVDTPADLASARARAQSARPSSPR